LHLRHLDISLLQVLVQHVFDGVYPLEGQFHFVVSLSLQL
jgi:hypothetical protein